MFAIANIDRATGLPRRAAFSIGKFLVAALTVMMLAACAGSPTQESTGEYIDDTAITTKVKSKLLADEEVSGLAINVETFKGVVQLSGFVKTDGQRDKAERIAESVGGVKDVRNEIALR